MLCYSFLEKRGDYIKKLINWSLLNDGKIVINNKNIECEFEVDKFIKYLENKETMNIIDLENKFFSRENNEFIFKIDFNKNTFSYILKENNITVEDKIECKIIEKNNIINLKYKLDEEEKEIIIHLL